MRNSMRIAEGIRRLPQERNVVIEGHTDATGTDGYNLALPQRRAAAVKDYLVRVQGIDAARLGEAGVGSRAPLATRMRRRTAASKFHCE